jgi:myo-inositol-1(or 4)-monophosphatase
MNHDLEELLECALSAATVGANELLSRFRGPLEISSKTSPEDHVTDADLASEAVVRDRIGALRPEDTITGEELENQIGANAKVRWSIDPLDGTINFTRGLPNYATSVGAADVETGEWLVGAVVAPSLGLVYYTKRGQGSFVIRGLRFDGSMPDYAAAKHTRLTGPPRERTTKILATGFSYSAEKRAGQFEELKAIMPEYVDLRRMGSAALDMCAVAEGSIDAYFERDIKEYDWAAAALIAEEAGLTVQRPAFVGDLCHVRLV